MSPVVMKCTPIQLESPQAQDRLDWGRSEGLGHISTSSLVLEAPSSHAIALVSSSILAQDCLSVGMDKV